MWQKAGSQLCINASHNAMGGANVDSKSQLFVLLVVVSLYLI